MKRAALLLPLLLGALAAAAPARAEGRTVAVVVDRSGSLCHADPQGRGPRVLAAALALALEPADRLLLVDDPAGQDEPVAPGAVAELAGRLRALVGEAAPRDGGCDLGALLASAATRVGQGGLVLVFTDDDLDVIGAGGKAPLEVVERARRKEPRPARDALNRAALELLAERLRALPGRTLLGLRAPLPPGARTVPLLEAVGARAFELEQRDEDALLDGLVEALRGEPSLSQTRSLAAGEALELPGPARVVLRGEGRLELAGAHPLDADGRLVVLDAPAGPLRPGPAARAWVAPRAPLPDGVRAFALRGAARVLLLGEDPHRAAGELVLRWGAREARLEGSPPQAQLPPAAGPLTLLRVVAGEGGRRAVAASRELFPDLVEVPLVAPAGGTAGLPLELSASPPAELAWREPIPLRLRGPGGRVERLVLVAGAEGRFQAQFTPPSEGSWEAQPEGLLPVRLAAPLAVAAGARHLLRIEELLGPDGQPLHELQPDAERMQLRLKVAVEPPLPAPLELRVALNDAPPGAAVSLAAPLQVRDRGEAIVLLDWPDALGEARVLLRVLGPDGSPLGATHGFLVQSRRSLARRLAAAGVLSVAIVWGLVVVLRRRRAQAAALEEPEEEEEELDEPLPRLRDAPPEVATRLGTRQLRGLGTNGKISVERYAFLEHSREDSSVVISPEDTSVSVELHVRDDGTVKAKAVEGAKLIHEDRPELLVNETTLRHGNAFAVVEGPRARRYVYLEREPDAEELQTRFVSGTVSQEAEMRDSGMFVVLDDHHEVTPESARLVSFGPGLLGRDSDDEMLDGSSDVDEPGEADDDGLASEAPERPVSDEGLLYLDSDESQILDSQDPDGTGPDDDTSTGKAAPLPPTRPPAPPLPARPPVPPRPPAPPRPPGSDLVIGGSASDVAPPAPEGGAGG